MKDKKIKTIQLYLKHMPNIAIRQPPENKHIVI